MYDVVVIGSGPAGYSAAIYTSRAQLKTLLISGPQEGGQLTTTTEIENYPGFPKGIKGPQLMSDMKAQAEKFGTNVASDVITNIQYSNTPIKTFIVKGQENQYEGKGVIIATGASAQKLGIPSEEIFAGKGVSYCATCDGFFFRGKEIIVVGGGDTAMEEATFLTKFVNRVTIIHRREEFSASPIMLARAKNDPKITFLTNKIIEEIIGKTSVEGVRLKDTKTGQLSTYDTQGVFVAIGHTPNTEFIKNFIDMDSKGYIIIQGLRNPDDFHTATNVLGIFAAGDCVDFQYRQATVAAGMGVMAATDAQKWIEKILT